MFPCNEEAIDFAPIVIFLLIYTVVYIINVTWLSSHTSPSTIYVNIVQRIKMSFEFVHWKTILIKPWSLSRYATCSRLSWKIIMT